MTKTPLRAAIYARQSVKVDEGVDQQVKHCRTVAEGVHGWQVVKVYEDNATSASRARGEGTKWAAMLADFDRGEFDVLMAVSVDRLLRRVVDVVELRASDRADGRKTDIRVVTARDGIDTASSMGNTVLTILVALAEAEIETKKARNIPYAIARREAGHPWAGRVPYGYAWIAELNRDEAGTRWRQVEAEAEVVKRMFRYFLKPGAKLGALAAALNAEHIPGPTGKAWHPSTVRRILLSPFYAALLPPAQGWADFKPETVVEADCTPGAWEPIVDIEDYRAARHVLLQTDRRTNPEGTARKWLLSGIAFCATCRTPVRSARTREGYHGYRCPNGHFLRRGDILDTYAADAVIKRLEMPDAATLLTPRPDGVDVGTLRALRASIDERELALAEAIAAGLSAAAAQPSLEKLRAERESIAERIDAAMNTDPLAELVGAPNVRELWEGLALGAQRAILAALVYPFIAPVGKGTRVVDAAGAERTMPLVWRDFKGRHDPSPYFLDGEQFVPGDLSDEARETLASNAKN